MMGFIMMGRRIIIKIRHRMNFNEIVSVPPSKSRMQVECHRHFSTSIYLHFLSVGASFEARRAR